MYSKALKRLVFSVFFPYFAFVAPPAFFSCLFYPLIFMPFLPFYLNMVYHAKGANAERELMHLFFEKGFSVVRIAGSGTSPLPAPDIIALKKGRIIAVECKARKAQNLAVSVGQVGELSDWAEKAGAEAFVGWKIPRKGWFFLKPEQLKNTGKFFTINQADAMAKGCSLESVACP
jgi:Holliday junction resolvase